MKIKVNKLSRSSKTPSRAHYNDAGADVFTKDDIVIRRSETVAIPLGISIEIPDGYMGCIYPKSGLTKKGIVCHIPPIDSGYRGEIHAIVTNTSNDDYMFCDGEKVGQLVITQVILAEYVTELTNDRGEGAFGSTGK